MVKLDIKANGVTIAQFDREVITEKEYNVVYDIVTDLLGNGKNKIILDLKTVINLTSSGVKLFLDIQNDIKNSGGSLVLVNVKEKIKEVLLILDVLHFFIMFDSIEEADKYMNLWH